jgi:hypothetical protein
VELPNTVGVFLVLEFFAVPFGYEGAAALMNEQWAKAVKAYLIGVPIALSGLIALGIPILGYRLSPSVGTFLVDWLRPLSNPFVVVVFLVGALVWVRWSGGEPRLTALAPLATSRSWPALSREQIASLRIQIAKAPPMAIHKIDIVREDFPDCADLADDIAKAFQGAGWEVSGMGRIWGDLLPGIKILGPKNDQRKSIFMSILADVLGPEFDISIGMNEPHPWANVVPDAMVIRIAIGRRPRS